MIYSSELIKGTLKTIVLKLLADNKQMYGYEIVQTVGQLTKEKLEITEGALYPTLHTLEVQRWVKIKYKLVDNRERKYYSLTPAGKKASREKLTELAGFIGTLLSLLQIKPAKK